MRTGTCTTCGLTKHSRWKAGKCGACYVNSLIKRVDTCETCKETKESRWLRNMCNACYQTQRYKRVDTCTSCGVTKESRWINGKVCESCKQLERRFGLTFTEFTNLIESQGGVCAICNREPDHGTGRKWCVDHCHVGGHTRGLLCSNCNTMIGLAQENTSTLLSAIDYLRKWPKPSNENSSQSSTLLHSATNDNSRSKSPTSKISASPTKKRRKHVGG